MADFYVPNVFQICKLRSSNELETPKRLNDDIIKKIIDSYGLSEEEILEQLDAIKRNNDFKEGGYGIPSNSG